jgi:hypothetical protein
MRRLKPFLFILVSLAAYCSMAQSAGSEKRWNELKTGMSDIEVQKIMGPPPKTEQFATVKNNTSDTSVYWSYSNNYVVVITNHLYERVEKNRDALLKSLQQKAAKKDPGGLRIVTYGKK